MTRRTQPTTTAQPTRSRSGQIVRRQRHGSIFRSRQGAVHSRRGYLRQHDTIYGCCSEPNNFLRYGIRGTHSCFANFVEALAQFGLDRSYLVSNVNFFMSVPVAADGAAVNVYGHSTAGNYVDLRAERNVLAVLSNCPQMHNPCNAYKLRACQEINAQSGG
jgi:uncharacterized protein YcgI (DUF1989 family)